jgi:hypothetical protein
VITVEQEAAIHAAMERTGGKQSEAAVLLAVPRKALADIIRNNTNLKTRWVTPKEGVEPTTEAVAIHRPALPTPPTEGAVICSEREIAAAIEAEDNALKKGLDAVGLSTKTRDFAVALQKLHNKHYTKAIDMLGGGITKGFLDIMVEVEALTAKLNDTAYPPTIEQEMLWREDRAKLLDVMSKFYDRALQADQIKAKIEHLKSLAKNGNRPAGKPGFSPLVAVQVNGGQTTVKQGDGT